MFHSVRFKVLRERQIRKAQMTKTLNSSGIDLMNSSVSSPKPPIGKVDYLRGFKENVTMGHIIPAGTGYDYHRKVNLKPLVEEIPYEEPNLLVDEPLAG
jgi:hypothetical protein